MTIETVIFDVGETLVDDTREMTAWARWLHVPVHTFCSVWGAARARGLEDGAIFAYFRPGIDVDRERSLREEAGVGERIEEADLYPDARPALSALRERGLTVGIAGNLTAAMADLLRDLDLPVDAVATSAEWGVRKPDRGFFDRTVAMCGGNRETTLYVGDRPDRDVYPARHAGLRSAWIPRGVQGFLNIDDPKVRAAADHVLGSLTELADLIQPAS